MTDAENSVKPLHIIILAAGAGRRMRSSQPKVLQPVGGQPMLAHVLETAQRLQPAAVHIVYGHQGAAVRAAFAGQAVNWVEQLQQRGTGHAVQVALAAVPDVARVLVLYGDAPLIPAAHLPPLIGSARALAVLSARVDEPAGYGRILRTADGGVAGIVEERDADEQQRRICEINTGVLSADAADLRRWLNRIDDANAQGEWLLTDVVALAAAESVIVAGEVAGDARACLGANDRAQLAALEQLYQRQRRAQLLAAGVMMADPSQVQIRARVQHGRDVFLDVGVILEGEVQLGDDVRIGPGCLLKDVILSAGTQVAAYSVLEGVTSTGSCQIGPFSRLRPGSELAAGSKVGNFVEMKKTRLGVNSKASHLSYLGDSEIDDGVNIGAGTITCNYDGVNKHRTVIRTGAFIGSNTALVAPVTVGENSVVGAGSTITTDVSDGSLALTRAPQKQLPWPKKKRKKNNL